MALEISDAKPNARLPTKDVRNMNAELGHPRETGAGKPAWVVRIQLVRATPGQRNPMYKGKVPPAMRHRTAMGTAVNPTTANKRYFSQGILRSRGDEAGNTAKK